MSFRIYLSPPDVGDLERQMLLAAFDSGWIAPVGPDLQAFEEEMCAFTGAAHAVALSSGTAGLHLLLVALGVGAGDEVIVPTLTFAATANAVCYVGAEPVFMDVSPGTWTLDPALLEEFLAERSRCGRLPKAVISVDLYGQCCDYAKIEEICERYGVELICDAAEALGATCEGRAAGTFGRAGVFSFNGNKIITTSGGGMVVSNDGELVERLRYLATQARQPVVHYEHTDVGYNYRLSNLLAALGRAQLRNLPRRIASRQVTFNRYQAAFAPQERIAAMPIATYGNPNYWLTCITLEDGPPAREAVSAALHRAGIESRPVWKPMHLQPVFANFNHVRGSVSASVFESGLCLPSGSTLTDADRSEIIRIVLDAATGGALRRSGGTGELLARDGLS